ncbi:MAG: penicillin-binding protein [Rikenellaceae bacterium]
MADEELQEEEIVHEADEQELEREACKEMAKRANYILYALFAGFAMVIYAIISLQFFGGDLREEAEGTNFRLIDIPAKRGDILSANGTIISSSVKKYKVYMDLRPKQLSSAVFDANYGALADSLSRLFHDASGDGYRARLRKWRAEGHGNKLISPPGVLLDYNELQRLKKFPILNGHPLNGGAKEQYQYVRMNYYGSLAQRTIGRQETATAKGYGIELNFDEQLRGQDGKSYERKVSGSFWMPAESANNIEPIDGCDIMTTIDANIQDAAESSVRRKLDESHATWGTAVVMEVESGEIRAMVNLGRNKKGEIIEDYNHAIGDNVEPGSTYKLMSLLILLDNTDMTIETMIDTKKGVDYINKVRVSDSDRGGYGVIPLKTAMSKSSNIGFAHAVDDKFRGKAHEYITAVHKTGISQDINFQIAGEKRPVIKSDSARSWSPADLVTMSYGYASRFTALRILMLYNAIANDGKMIKPLVVKEIRRRNSTEQKFETEVLNDKICSNSTLKQARTALEDVMFDGTVRLVFRGESYVVAGKTGTARQVGPNGRYDNNPDGLHYLATFVGYFPANDPKYSCIVQFKTVKPYGIARPYYGAALSAPVFKDISHYISSQSDWGRRARDYAADKEKELMKLREQKALTSTKPVVKMKSAYGDSEEIDYTKIPIRAVGDEDAVDYLRREFDLKDYTLEYTRKEETKDDYIKKSVMPNVVGLGLKEALSRIEAVGLSVVVNGKGRVVRQSILEGVKVKKGDRVTITLSLGR